MKDRLAIVGYSGHSYVVLDAAIKADLTVVAYTEAEEKSYNPFHLEYLGYEGDHSFDGWNRGYGFILGIGENSARERAAMKVIDSGNRLCSVIHPASEIGVNDKIGVGSFIAAGVLINPMVTIGRAVIINTGSIIEHECQIAAGVHIAPGAVLAGNVTVGDRTFIGANSIIKEGTVIGSDVVIGAGSVVLHDVKSGSRVVGNPARLI